MTFFTFPDHREWCCRLDWTQPPGGCFTAYMVQNHSTSARPQLLSVNGAPGGLGLNCSFACPDIQCTQKVSPTPSLFSHFQPLNWWMWVIADEVPQRWHFNGDLSQAATWFHMRKEKFSEEITGWKHGRHRSHFAKQVCVFKGRSLGNRS